MFAVGALITSKSLAYANASVQFDNNVIMASSEMELKIAYPEAKQFHHSLRAKVSHRSLRPGLNSDSSPHKHPFILPRGTVARLSRNHRNDLSSQPQAIISAPLGADDHRISRSSCRPLSAPPRAPGRGGGGGSRLRRSSAVPY